MARTRWPDQIPGSDWGYGTDRGYLQQLCEYWATRFDWRAQEERFNRWPRFAVEDVHRFLGVLAGTFIALHIFWLAIDSQAHLGVSGLLIPFTSSYRPLWTGLGVVAAELLLALAVTNHYRKRISYSLWRRLHYLNFAVWALTLAHGIAAGTDAGVTRGRRSSGSTGDAGFGRAGVGAT